VLHEYEVSAGLENAPHLDQRGDRICSAEPLTSDTGIGTSAVLFLADRSSFAEGSIAQTWPTADP
jgi:hypothetical protein